MDTSTEKPRKVLILPTDKEYKTASREALFALAVTKYRNDSRLSSQTGIAAIISEMTNGACTFTQSNMSKAKKYFIENDVEIKNTRVILRKDSNGYYIFDDKDSAKNRILNMIADGLFLNESLYYNDVHGIATMFIFKVGEDKKDIATDRFRSLIGKNDIFDIIWHEDKLIILLNPTSRNNRRNSDMLKKFFDTRPEGK